MIGLLAMIKVNVPKIVAALMKDVFTIQLFVRIPMLVLLMDVILRLDVPLRLLSVMIIILVPLIPVILRLGVSFLPSSVTITNSVRQMRVLTEDVLILL